VTLPRLYALTDLQQFPESSARLARLCQLAAPGALAIVVRDRELPTKRRLGLGRALRAATSDTGQLLFVVDRVDLALELGADGVHLPTGGLWPSDALRLSPTLCLSRAHHDADQLPASELALLSAVWVSPVFAQRKGRSPLQMDGFRRRATELRAFGLTGQVVALGGVNAAQLRMSQAMGADAVAVIGAAHQSEEQQLLVLQALAIERTHGAVGDDGALRRETRTLRRV
jgi:thiamine-phosphate pyrophosphorylase